MRWQGSKRTGPGLRIHVHVAHSNGEAKVLTDAGIFSGDSIRLVREQLREAQTVVQTHIEEIQNAWTRHFGS